MKVGIVGGGQLGRMLALAGYPLGIHSRFLEPAEDPSVRGLGDVVRAGYADLEALPEFARGLDVVTYEFENVPVATARALERLVPVHPSPAALELAQDRLSEKTGLRELQIPTAPFAAVDSFDDLRAAARDMGFPLVIKTRRFGYDGKGQFIATDEGDLASGWEELGGRPLIAEGFIPFERELSIIAVRDRDGRIESYPITENDHAGGILCTSIAPAPDLAEDLMRAAQAYVDRLMGHLDYVGAIAIELFQHGGQLLANEVAPRVHNSGHWTQDGAVTSQFENHMRAVTGLPLGETGTRCERVGMVNLLGRVPALADILRIPGSRLHVYDKEPRPGRKLGHVNLIGTSGVVSSSMAAVRDLVGRSPAVATR
jgi:5-(carboxyamino)imidazole ribonucleotide synthase